MNTVTSTNTVNTKNLVDTVAANGSFKTFGKAIERAGMSDILRGVGPFTIFAPTDAAFEQLPAGKLEELFKDENKEELVSLLNYHVVSETSSYSSTSVAASPRTPLRTEPEC